MKPSLDQFEKLLVALAVGLAILLVMTLSSRGFDFKIIGATSPSVPAPPPITNTVSLSSVTWSNSEDGGWALVTMIYADKWTNEAARASSFVTLSATPAPSSDLNVLRSYCLQHLYESGIDTNRVRLTVK